MEKFIHSSSPKSVTSPIETLAYAVSSSSKASNNNIETEEDTIIHLEDFLQILPKTIRETQKERQNKHNSFDVKKDPIGALFSRLVLDKDEWQRYALFESNKNYTRNLIATDNETYTLVLMCWNPNKESPIHDHPCDGCWMRVCEGSVNECRYKKEGDDDEQIDSRGENDNKGNDSSDVHEKLICFSDATFAEGQLAYIADCMGYHKVGNPSMSNPAITMHLYSPPFQTCRIWLDPMDASHPSTSCMCYYSEYGVRI